MQTRKNNIHLFRGDNARELRNKLRIWRERFMEKHGDMNLLEVHKENMLESIIADATAMGFMGGMRMIIFHDFLIKEKGDDADEEKDKKESDTAALWVKTLEQAPETNFLIFIGNKKPSSDLEKWFEENATIHEFAAATPREMQTLIIQELGVSARQAVGICDRLGFSEEFKYGKNIVMGKPDFIYQEIEKLKLAGKREWTDDELKKALPDYREENVFDLLNPLWDRRRQESYRLFQNLMATADHELTMATVITMLRKTLIAATFPGKIDSLPITDGQKKTGKSLTGAKKDLKKLYDDIVSVDIAEKSGELPGKKEAFLMALMGFCT